MKHVRKAALAATAFTCAALFSFGWSEQSGISLSVENAQARVGRPLTPVSVAGVARRQARRGAYGYGYGARAVGVGAAAIGTAAAVGAATSPWGWGGGPYYGSYAAQPPSMGMMAPITAENWQQYQKNLHDSGYDLGRAKTLAVA
jgi:hypothetical protein